MRPSKSNVQEQQKRFGIYKLGGSGKTQVCLKYAENHREEWACPICFRSLRIMTLLQVLGQILGTREQHRELGTRVSTIVRSLWAGVPGIFGPAVAVQHILAGGADPRRHERSSYGHLLILPSGQSWSYANHDSEPRLPGPLHRRVERARCDDKRRSSATYTKSSFNRQCIQPVDANSCGTGRSDSIILSTRDQPGWSGDLTGLLQNGGIPHSLLLAS